MDTDVWILGGYQSDFARNLTKEGLDFADLTREVVDAALAAAKVDAADIGVVHVANAFGEMFAEQGHLGAMPATVCDGLWDTPASRHEAACASGSVAALAAMADLRSGNYDTALVRRRRAGEDRARRHRRPSSRRRGVDRATRGPTRGSSGHRCSPRSPTSTTAATAWTTPICGRSRNSTSPTRAETPTRRPENGRCPTRSATTTRPTRVIEGRLRRFDCSQMTDGGAGVVLVTDKYLRDHPDARPIARIAGWGHRTVGLGLRQKLDRAA